MIRKLLFLLFMAAGSYLFAQTHVLSPSQKLPEGTKPINLENQSKSIYQLAYFGPVAFFWDCPDSFGDDEFGVRFTSTVDNATLKTAGFAFYSQLGDPDINVNVYDVSGGLPNTLLGTLVVPFSEISFYPSITNVDLSSLNLTFNNGDEFIISYSVVGGLFGSVQMDILSDDATTLEDRSVEKYLGVWETFTAGWGDNYELIIISTLETPNFTCDDANAVLPGTYSTDGPTEGGGASNNCVTGATNAVWYSYTPSENGTIDIEAISSTSGTDTRLSVHDGSCASLNCLDSDDDGGAGLLSMLTGVPVTAGTTYYIEWDDRWGSPYDFEWTLTFNAPLANDDCSGAIPVFCGDVVSGSTTSATNSGIVDCNGFGNTAADVWYSFTGTGGMVSASLCTGTTYDSRITVFEGTCGSLFCVDANDDYCGLQSRIDWYAESGVNYFIMVHGYNTSTGAFELTVDCTDPIAATWIGGDASFLDPNPLEDWFGADNWDVQDVPGETTNVTLPAGLSNYPTIDRMATCNNISLASDASGTATLLDNSYLMVNGTAAVDRYFSGNDLDWHLVSSPISNAQASVFLDMYLQSFDNSDYSYTDIDDELTPLNVMEGYALYSTLGATNTVSFMGNLNLGTQSAPISTGADSYNWNLMGNPYPSSIDWEAVTIPTNMSNEVHYIEAATGNDLSYVKGSGGTGSQYIPPMQGFFVSALGADNLQFDDAVRSHSGSGTFYKSDNPNLLILEAANETFVDETWIHFNENAGAEHDGQFDAYKRISLSNPALPQIFSYTPEGVKLGVNGMPQTNMVPAGFTAVESGDFTISAKETGEFSIVILEDLVTGAETDLLTDSYTFSYAAGTPENRFIVHFSPLAINDNAVENLNIYSFGKDVYVKVPEFTSGTIVIYNLMGQEVLSASINGVLNKLTLEEGGYYVVVVNNEDQIITDKVFIK